MPSIRICTLEKHTPGTAEYYVKLVAGKAGVIGELDWSQEKDGSINVWYSGDVTNLPKILKAIEVLENDPLTKFNGMLTIDGHQVPTA